MKNEKSMKISVCVFFLTLIVVSGAFAKQPVMESRSGEIVLRETSDVFDHSNAFAFEIGDRLKLNCRYFITTVFGRKVIWAGADVLNTSDTTMHFAYYVAFFDADDNLVGAAAETSMMTGIPPGKTLHLTNCMIPVPPSGFARITTYKTTLFESETEIGR